MGSTILFPSRIEDREELMGMMSSTINRLVDVYKYSTEEFYLDTIPRNEVRVISIFEVNEDGTESPFVVGHFDYGGGIGIARYSSVPQKALDLFQSGAELPIPEMLMLNARRESLLENFRLAVVEEAAAFEALVDEVLSRYYAVQGKSTPEIENILGAGLKNLLRNHIPKCCGEAFIDTPTYENLYAKRNEIVHRGAAIGKEEAGAAIEAGRQAVAWLNKRSNRGT